MIIDNWLHDTIVAQPIINLSRLFFGYDAMRGIHDNVIVVKSKAFALRIIKLHDYLTGNKIDYILARQILKSGTSIGANIREAVQGQSKADFIAKMNIALKEASETQYWIELLGESGKLTPQQARSLHDDCLELLRLLTSIVKTSLINKSNG